MKPGHSHQSVPIRPRGSRPVGSGSPMDHSGSTSSPPNSAQQAQAYESARDSTGLSSQSSASAHVTTSTFSEHSFTGHSPAQLSGSHGQPYTSDHSSWPSSESVQTVHFTSDVQAPSQNYHSQQLLGSHYPGNTVQPSPGWPAGDVSNTQYHGYTSSPNPVSGLGGSNTSVDVSTQPGWATMVSQQAVQITQNSELSDTQHIMSDSNLTSASHSPAEDMIFFGAGHWAENDARYLPRLTAGPILVRPSPLKIDASIVSSTPRSVRSLSTERQRGSPSPSDNTRDKGRLPRVLPPSPRNA